jgi:hypothetical protein
MGRLREVADSFLHDVETALEEHPELAEQLKEMLEAEEAEDEDDEAAFETHRRVPGPARGGLDPDRPPPDAPPGLPSGKALVEAVEKYLQQRRGDEDGEGPPPPRGPVV